jgi:hypothetical protein
MASSQRRRRIWQFSVTTIWVALGVTIVLRNHDNLLGTALGAASFVAVTHLIWKAGKHVTFEDSPRDMKDRLVAYVIWIAWGCMPVVLVWIDPFPFGAPGFLALWLAFMVFAGWITTRHMPSGKFKPPAQNPDAKAESN